MQRAEEKPQEREQTYDAQINMPAYVLAALTSEASLKNL